MVLGQQTYETWAWHIGLSQGTGTTFLAKFKRTRVHEILTSGCSLSIQVNGRSTPSPSTMAPVYQTLTEEWLRLPKG